MESELAIPVLSSWSSVRIDRTSVEAFGHELVCGDGQVSVSYDRSSCKLGSRVEQTDEFFGVSLYRSWFGKPFRSLALYTYKVFHPCEFVDDRVDLRSRQMTSGILSI